MNWLKNLKIIQKLLVLIGLCAVFISIVGFVGYYFCDNSQKDMSSMYNDRLVPIQLLNENRAYIWKIKGSILDAAINDKERPLLIEEIKKTNADMNKNFDVYAATKLIPEEEKLVGEVKPQLVELTADLNGIYENLAINNDKAVYKDYYETEISIDKINESFVALSDINEKVAQEMDAQADKDAVFATFLIVATIAVAVVVAVLVGMLIANMVATPVKQVVENLKEIAGGNLTVKNIDNDSKDETGELAQSLNTTVKTLRDLVHEVARSAEDIAASSEEMSASSEQTAQGAQQTASSTTQLAQGAQEISRNVEDGASNINKMNKAIQGISEEAVVVAKLGNETETNANTGAEHVKKAVYKIDSIKNVAGDISVNIAELGQLSSEIEQIVDLIKNIAGQTNLLALNAAIEAARAGEHGKGFAVVADEVKKLAGQSAGATEKITTMIKEIQNKTHVAVNTMDKATKEVEEGVFVINDAGKALENIISQVKAANGKIQSITKDIDGVARNSEDIVQIVENISAVTEETAASAEEISSITEEQTASMEEISASAQTLATIAEKLTKQVAVFKV